VLSPIVEIVGGVLAIGTGCECSHLHRTTLQADCYSHITPSDRPDIQLYPIPSLAVSCPVEYDILTHVATISVGYYGIGTVGVKIAKDYAAAAS
jgi:hypothetical protein